eukprot:CAMPEP_0172499438 /NCGR_PEP_ID=MMETSP1066-20121228/127128_1 /TAXON_ID=671091 /ORGANISM="Coscinodiscus wailesii, Strain CCMP2513" /LENGTH=492 /DNA_ID=CAMNT_0013273181 /DNA_START=381 /DNA_END=1859 /DNA_ORIENTATION=+
MSQPIRKASPTTPGQSGPSWGVDANTAGGGVWAQTSSKREKLLELRAEITAGKKTLDDMATPNEKCELDFADGLTLLVRSTANHNAEEDWKCCDGEGGREVLEGLYEMLDEGESGSAAATKVLNEREYGDYLNEVVNRVDRFLNSTASIHDGEETLTTTRSRLASHLALIRDFVVDPQNPSAAEDAAAAAPTTTLIPTPVQTSFTTCLILYKLHLFKSTARTLLDSWTILTAVTDADVDRAAVRGEDISPATVLPRDKINAVLRSAGRSSDGVAAVWDLMDKDDDGLLDQEEMERVVNIVLDLERGGLTEFVRGVFDDGGDGGVGVITDPLGTVPETKGWRQRRRDRKYRKQLMKSFNQAASHHFEIEVETPHRLRCVYAWAEKGHQDGQVDSTLVDATPGVSDDGGGGALASIVGRKRYVELDPKISLGEFREVQRECFGHLDRVGEEICGSWREDLLVVHGRKRQFKELKRDCALFFGVVSLIDLGIFLH